MHPQEILSGAKTVVSAAEHFTEMKQAAQGLFAKEQVSSRGYFIPREEVSAGGLLVSYWQARNALLDLITSFRTDRDLSDEDRPAAFLAAFGGALVLIDAARFLRENVHDRPVLREKLNQPLPEFGIPEDAYETVQRSLLGTRNAWHLYYAIQYFHQHEKLLAETAQQNPDLQQVWEIIDRLRPHIEVSKTRFAQAKLRSRASQMGGIVGDLFASAIYGLQKLGGVLVSNRYLRVGHRPHLPKNIEQQIVTMLLPGDVIVVRKDHALTNYFLPGYWPHIALFLGNAEQLASQGLDAEEHIKPRWSQLLSPGDGSPRVLESMRDGVLIRPLSSPLSSDSVVILRPQINADDLRQGLAQAFHHEGKRYDFSFDFTRSDRLVCTEVVYRSYDNVGGLEFPLTRRAGRLTLSGGDMIQLGINGDQWRPIAAYAAPFASGVVTGNEAVEVMKKGLQA